MIPTNLFANTKLHAIIEQAVDDQGDFNTSKIPNYLQDADFCGIDRSSESVSQNVESTITLEGVSLVGAQKILELCTTSANETEGIIYLNKSVKAELLGVATDVLELIPFDGSIMQNDEQGVMPFGEVLIQFWQNPLK
ncbi:MAG: hypothetical protein GF329_03175, partial [Candidatus Lokiarchaeota archaeon]|nr:hypothetical protein [Candidatus Lokiarchaeota archaeon]